MIGMKQIEFDGQKFFAMECIGGEWCTGCGKYDCCEAFCEKPRDTVFAAGECTGLGRAINLCDECQAAFAPKSGT